MLGGEVDRAGGVNYNNNTEDDAHSTPLGNTGLCLSQSLTLSPVPRFLSAGRGHGLDIGAFPHYFPHHWNDLLSLHYRLNESRGYLSGTETAPMRWSYIFKVLTPLKCQRIRSPPFYYQIETHG